MKIWILLPREDLEKNDNPWEPWYDKAFGFIIRAETEKEAREKADEDAGDENRGDTRHPWLEKKYSSCEELSQDGESMVIIRDFASA
jgi:hypothetical protein